MNPRGAKANAALAVMVVLMSLSVGELALRAFVTLPLARVDPEVRYPPDPVRRFSLLPNQAAFTYGAPVTIDANGFRRNTAKPSAPGRQGPVILAIGDSFTFGLGVRDGETWPAQHEKRLRAKTSPSVAVVNSGTINCGVFQEMEMDLLRSSGLLARPGIVVHGLYWNDFMNAAPPPADAPTVVTPSGYFTWDRPADSRTPLRRLASWATANSALLFSIPRADRFLPEDPDGHLNAAGYELIADAVVERLLTVPEMSREPENRAGLLR